MRELAVACGIPKDLWQIFPANDIRVGLNALNLFDHVTYIGNSADGADVAVGAGEALIGSSLFLATKNIGVVAADADLSVAVPCVARSAYVNTGSSSVNLERLWVHRDIADEFIYELTEHLNRHVRIGKSFDHTYTFGSMYSQFRYDRCVQHINDAIDLGARVIHGGRPRPDLGPWFVEPTVLTNVSQDALMWSEETYGPVLDIEIYDDLDQPCEDLIDIQYGHVLMVYTQDKETVARLKKSSRTGLVSVNDSFIYLWANKHLPISSSRETGNGIRFGIEGLAQYTMDRSTNWQSFGNLDISDKNPPEKYERNSSRLLSITLIRRWFATA